MSPRWIWRRKNTSTVSAFGRHAVMEVAAAEMNQPEDEKRVEEASTRFATFVSTLEISELDHGGFDGIDGRKIVSHELPRVS